MTGRELVGPEQVTAALLQLVANAGNVAKTARELDYVTEPTLRAWKNDVHAEQYRRLEEQHGRELELQMVDQARQTVIRAGEIERKLLDEMENVRPDLRPQALRAVADVRAKNVDRLLSLTGRPVQPKDMRSNDIVELLKGMEARGYLRIAAGLTLEVDEQAPTSGPGGGSS